MSAWATDSQPSPCQNRPWSKQVLGHLACAEHLHSACEMPILASMHALILTQTTPLFTDEDGTLRIMGSRIPLDTIVHEFNQGATAEQIQDSFPSLSLRSIYGAIAFYLEHQAAIDAYLHCREQAATELRHRIESRPEIAAFRERLRHRRAQLLSASRQT